MPCLRSSNCAKRCSSHTASVASELGAACSPARIASDSRDCRRDETGAVQGADRYSRARVWRDRRASALRGHWRAPRLRRHAGSGHVQKAHRCQFLRSTRSSRHALTSLALCRLLALRALRLQMAVPIARRARCDHFLLRCDRTATFGRIANAESVRRSWLALPNSLLRLEIRSHGCACAHVSLRV